MITRRRVVIALGVGALAPFATFAQSRKIWRIGLLRETKQLTDVARLTAFKEGMKSLGYVEGTDYVIEIRFAESDFSRLPTLVAEMVSQKMDLILTSGTPSAIAASKGTREIPIVMPTVGDPVGSGLVATLARPGGNITGLSTITSELVSKRLDLLRQLSPRIHRVGLIYDPNNPIDRLVLMRFESTCANIKMVCLRAPATKPDNIAAAFDALKIHKAQGIIVTSSGINNADRQQITELATQYRIPAIYSQIEYADVGGLISYAPDFTDMNRRAAAYVDKIIKGAKPGDLPIEQPTKFDLVVNMKTAKALGSKIPQSILVQATKVIE